MTKLKIWITSIKTLLTNSTSLQHLNKQNITIKKLMYHIKQYFLKFGVVNRACSMVSVRFTRLNKFFSEILVLFTTFKLSFYKQLRWFRTIILYPTLWTILRVVVFSIFYMFCIRTLEFSENQIVLLRILILVCFIAWFYRYRWDLIKKNFNALSHEDQVIHVKNQFWRVGISVSVVFFSWDYVSLLLVYFFSINVSVVHCMLASNSTPVNFTNLDLAPINTQNLIPTNNASPPNVIESSTPSPVSPEEVMVQQITGPLPTRTVHWLHWVPFEPRHIDLRLPSGAIEPTQQFPNVSCDIWLDAGRNLQHEYIFYFSPYNAATIYHLRTLDPTSPFFRSPTDYIQGIDSYSAYKYFVGINNEIIMVKIKATAAFEKYCPNFRRYCTLSVLMDPSFADRVLKLEPSLGFYPGSKPFLFIPENILTKAKIIVGSDDDIAFHIKRCTKDIIKGVP